MIHIGICDDEMHSRKMLETFCRQFFDTSYAYHIRQYASGEEVLSGELPDILLLDIEMDGMDGIQLKELLVQNPKKVRILFVTSHGELAPEGYGDGVFGFLTKPLEYAQFEKKMQLMMAELGNANRYVMISGVHGNCSKALLSDVLYLKASGKYVHFYMNDGQKIFDDRGIAAWTTELEDKGFASPRKGYLVNLSRVKELQDDQVVFLNGERVPLSRRMKTVFREKYFNHLFRNAKR